MSCAPVPMRRSNQNCPVCGSSAIESCFDMTRGDLESRPIYRVSVCRDCSHHWASGPVSKELMSEIYSRYFYGTAQQSAPHFPDGSLTPEAERYPPLVNARRRARLLHDRGMRGRLLDVGSGVGYFVLAASEYFDAEGIEIEDTATEKAKAIGARVRQGDALAPAPPGERGYGVVTLWDVFSGFTDPVAAVDGLLARVEPGGYFVVTMPDAGSLIARVARRRWPLMIPPGNMHFYTEASARRLFDRPDVAAVNISRETKWVSVDFLAHKLLRALGLHRAARWPRPIPPHWKLPINLGDIMLVVVEKSRRSVGGAA